MDCLQEDGTRSTEVWSIFAALIFLQVLKRYVPVKRVFLDFVVRHIVSMVLHLIRKTPLNNSKDSSSLRPDYSKDDFWACLPTSGNSNAEIVPTNEAHVVPSERLCDLFFLHPTGFYGKAWNEPLDPGDFDKASTEQLNNWMLATQASAFNETCRIYAPRYRQAHIESFYCDRVEGRKALDVAYEDVVAAFYDFLFRIKQYAKHHGTAGLPPSFVLASHSQGGWHLMRLIEEEIDCNPILRARVVCVYLIGSRMPLKKFQEYKFFKPSNKPDDTNCIVGWDTLSTEWKWGYMSRFLHEWPGYFSKDGEGHWQDARQEPILNTNPFTWKSNDVAEGKIYCDEENYHGSIVSDTTLQRPYTVHEISSGKALGFEVVRIKKIFPSFRISDDEDRFWTQATDIGLMVPPLRRTSSMGLFTSVCLFGWYHSIDYELFYFNIRKNVKDRVVAFMKKQHSLS
eukprot:g1592.t1